MLQQNLFAPLFWNPWTFAYLEWWKSFYGIREDSVMREYIRHPSDIPIDFQIDENQPTELLPIKDVSVGGLCFHADRELLRGSKIRIRIPMVYQLPNESEASAFEAEGVVAWCRAEDAGFAVGVQFDDRSTQFGVRMVEQVCHIEHYRYDVLQEQGRCLTSEEAALEWVERYASDFPG